MTKQKKSKLKARNLRAGYRNLKTAVEQLLAENESLTAALEIVLAEIAKRDTNGR